MTNRVVILLDESGSMEGQQDRVVAGINAYMKELKGKARVRVNLFEGGNYRTYFDDKLKSWVPMKMKDHRPGGGTPLFDSIARAINETSFDEGDRVVLIIDTDGFENMSHEHTQESVKALIENRKSRGWKVVFFGSGTTEQAAVFVSAQGDKMGAQTMSSSHDQRTGAYVGMSGDTRAHFSK